MYLLDLYSEFGDQAFAVAREREHQRKKDLFYRKRGARMDDHRRKKIRRRQRQSQSESPEARTPQDPPNAQLPREGNLQVNLAQSDTNADRRRIVEDLVRKTTEAILNEEQKNAKKQRAEELTRETAEALLAEEQQKAQKQRQEATESDQLLAQKVAEIEQRRLQEEREQLVAKDLQFAQLLNDSDRLQHETERRQQADKDFQFALSLTVADRNSARSERPQPLQNPTQKTNQNIREESRNLQAHRPTLVEGKVKALHLGVLDENDPDVISREISKAPTKPADLADFTVTSHPAFFDWPYEFWRYPVDSFVVSTTCFQDVNPAVFAMLAFLNLGAEDKTDLKNTADPRRHDRVYPRNEKLGCHLDNRKCTVRFECPNHCHYIEFTFPQRPMVLLCLEAVQNGDKEQLRKILMGRDANGRKFEYSHRCRNPPGFKCITPKHGEIESHALNMKRMGHHNGSGPCDCDEHCLLNPGYVMLLDRQSQFMKWVKPFGETISADPAIGAVKRYSELTCGLYFHTPADLLHHMDLCVGNCEQRMDGDDAEDSDTTVTGIRVRLVTPRGRPKAFTAAEERHILNWMDSNRQSNLEPPSKDLIELHRKTGKEIVQIINWIRNTRTKKMRKVGESEYEWK